MATILVVGGTGDIGRAIAGTAAARGDEVVITGRDDERARMVAAQLGDRVQGIGLDLARPHSLPDALATLGDIDHLVMTAADPRPNSLDDLDVDLAVAAVTIKLVGYAQVVRLLRGRIRPGGSVVLFGGLAKERPYPGSLMVTTFNAGITGLARALAREVAPVRVNAIHTAIVGNSPKWADVPVERLPGGLTTPIGRLVTREEVVDAVDFLLRNGAVNAVDLHLDGGLLIT